MTSFPSSEGWKPKQLGSFGTVQDFWGIQQFLKKPNELENGTQVNLFVKGVEPAWEDPANKNGGRWQVRYPTHIQTNISNKLWEDLTLGLIGEQFTYPDEITGIVISIKKKKDTISVWHKSGNDEEVKNTIRNDLIKILGIPDSAKLEY